MKRDTDIGVKPDLYDPRLIFANAPQLLHTGDG